MNQRAAQGLDFVSRTGLLLQSLPGAQAAPCQCRVVVANAQGPAHMPVSIASSNNSTSSCRILIGMHTPHSQNSKIQQHQSQWHQLCALALIDLRHSLIVSIHRQSIINQSINQSDIFVLNNNAHQFIIDFLAKYLLSSRLFLFRLGLIVLAGARLGFSFDAGAICIARSFCGEFFSPAFICTVCTVVFGISCASSCFRIGMVIEASVAS